MKKPYIYIAAPFFNPQQVEIVENIKAALDEMDILYFSPKDDCMFDPTKHTPEMVFKQNEVAMTKSDLMVVVTDGKDTGTIFEAGWAFAKGIPIIYMWLSKQPGQKFNIVLAATGSVTFTYAQMVDAIHDYIHGRELKKQYEEKDVVYE